jgi:hypothetical protein
MFVWFVMLFPTLLVGLFFFVLWRKHHVLYAPRDFSDEGNFMRHWIPSSAPILTEKEDAGDEEEATVQAPVGEIQDQESAEPVGQSSADFARPPSTQYERVAEARLVEDLVVRRMTTKYGLNFLRDVQLRGRADVRYDAIAEGPSGPVMLEVKLLSDLTQTQFIVRRELERLAAISYRLKGEELRGARLVLVIVTRSEVLEDQKHDLARRARREIDRANLPISVEVETFSLTELKSEEQ